MSKLSTLYQHYKDTKPFRPDNDPIQVKTSLLVFVYTTMALAMMAGIGYMYRNQKELYIQYPQQVIAELGIDYDQATIIQDSPDTNTYNLTFIHDGTEYVVTYRRATSQDITTSILDVSEQIQADKQ